MKVNLVKLDTQREQLKNKRLNIEVKANQLLEKLITSEEVIHVFDDVRLKRLEF